MFHYLLLTAAFLVYTPEDVCLMGQLDFTRCFVGNGGKHGGIISPILFNIYLDDLSMHLNSSRIGGYS